MLDDHGVLWTEEAQNEDNNLTWEKVQKIIDSLPPEPVFLVHPDNLGDTCRTFGIPFYPLSFDRPAMRKAVLVKGMRFIVSPIFDKRSLLRVENKQLIYTLIHEWKDGKEEGEIETINLTPTWVPQW
jgi:hypothetical protein